MVSLDLDHVEISNLLYMHEVLGVLFLVTFVLILYLLEV